MIWEADMEKALVHRWLIRNYILQFQEFFYFIQIHFILP